MDNGARARPTDPSPGPQLTGESGPDADSDAVAPPMSRRAVLVTALGAGGIVLMGGSGWLLLGRDDGGSATSLSRAAADAVTTGQPVTEYPPGDRGDPVELSGGTLTDDRLDLADLRGEVVVVNVWGSWCGPCRVEGPVLATLSREYLDQGVRFVGVDVKDNRAAALAFEAGFGITYPSIEDVDGRAVLALSQYVPASAVPVTLVLDRSGRVAARVLGAVREATLRALLDASLAEPA